MSEPFREGSALRATVPMPRGGACLMAGFPGLKTGIDGAGYIDPEGLQDTLLDLVDHGVETLLILPEEEELPEGSFALLQAALVRHGLRALYLPVTDFGAPDARFLEPWARLAPALQDAMREGRNLAVCCQYGAGRSGLTAALLLIEQGLGAAEAIARVRREHPEAVESDMQVTFLTAQAARA